MDKKSRTLVIVFIIILFFSVAFSFYKYIIIKDIDFYINEKEFYEFLLEE